MLLVKCCRKTRSCASLSRPSFALRRIRASPSEAWKALFPQEKITLRQVRKARVEREVKAAMPVARRISRKKTLKARVVLTAAQERRVAATTRPGATEMAATVKMVRTLQRTANARKKGGNAVAVVR